MRNAPAGIPNKKSATIKDIARLAKVSETTVSLAFSKGSRISEKTRARVVEIAQSIDYFPNLHAQSLRAGKTKTIGFVVLDIANPFYSRMIKCSTEIAIARGYEVVFADSGYEPARERDIVETMIKNRVRGIIMCFCEKTDESFALMKRTSLSCIAIDTCPAFYTGPYVVNDLRKAGYLAAEHLVGRGCRHLSFLTADDRVVNMSSFTLLERGFRSFFKPGADARLAGVVRAGMTVEAGISSFRRLIRDNPTIDGIFCVNDLCAFGTIEAADTAGLRVGVDIAIMGIDNLNISSISRMSLTSLDQPYEEMVRRATHALIDGIEDNSMPTVRLSIRPTIVQRESSGLSRKAVRERLARLAAGT